MPVVDELLGVRRGLRRASDLEEAGGSRPAPARWGLEELAGRVVELSGQGATAGLSLAVSVVLDAQLRGEPAAWISERGSTFFPPDAAACGVDLGALVVVRVPDARDVARVADRLVRSGAFGAVVLDLGERGVLPPAAPSRLAGLAKRHETAVLCLTRKSARAPSLGPLVSLRCTTERGEVDEDGRVTCRLRALKDRRRGSGWTHEEVRLGPDGLC